MKQDIAAIQDDLRRGRYSSEAQVAHGIVYRLLQALGWPVFDSRIVWPEYTLEGRRVDLALCHPAERPAVFIEIKNVGNATEAERQLFEYAFHIGISMAILTDGQEWSFFLPAERGHYADRRVYKLDLLERDQDEIESRLTRYLGYERTCRGDSLRDARSDYHDASVAREATAALPRAWQELLLEQDPILVELLSDKVETLCGRAPSPELVQRFLSASVSSVHNGTAVVRDSGPRRPASDQEESDGGWVGYEYRGIRHTTRNAIEIVVGVIELLSNADPTFMDRLAARRHGRKRRYIARNRSDLYPDRPDLCERFAHRLQSGWWLATNTNNELKRRFLQMAAEVAGVEFGRELCVSIGNGER